MLGATDDRTEDEWVAFCETVLAIAAAHAADDAATVLWNVMYTARCRSGYGRVLFGGRQPFRVKETICWDKRRGFPSASRGILSRNWELVFVLSRGEKYRTTQGTNEVRWAKWDDIKIADQAAIHHATFPVDLAVRALVDFAEEPAAVVFDPFAGTGTTLIACEQIGRVSRSLELEPRYCQMIIDRWEAFTGQRAVKVGEAVRV